MLYLSIGENCLVGKMLERFKIRSTWSTPYTWARSNISYALQCEKQKYHNLLDSDYIVKDENSLYPTLWRNKSFSNVPGLFEPSVSNGFEFTHHDVINKAEHKNSYERKIQRMLDLRSTDEDIVFFYHHRYTDNENNDFILNACEEFLKFYSSHKHLYIIILTQTLISDYSMRHIETIQEKNCIIVNFYTIQAWRGSAEGMVSGEIDDDLFIEMFKKLYEIKVLDDLRFLDNYSFSPVYYLNNNYDFIEERIMNFFEGKKENLYIWGSYELGYALAEYLLSRHFKITAFIDNDKEKNSKQYKGIPTIAYSEDIQHPNIILALKRKASENHIFYQITTDAKVLTYTELFNDLIP